MKLGNEVGTGKVVDLDISKLIDTRLLLQANSGGGKSWALRFLMENTYGKVQHIILDLEGEFSTLREKYEYLIVGKDGDLPINIKTAALLARKVLELNVSVIVDLYELEHEQRKIYVKRFLEAMINAPKALWHPCLVFVDETHVFDPEGTKSESGNAVTEMATRGRKRGYCLVGATQRLSKFNKDCAAELLNKMIGRTGLDVDMKRAAAELGFSNKEDILSLRDLDPGEFYVFGPALTKVVTKIKIGEVKTTHPKAGSRQLMTAPPASSKVKALLQKLVDLPKEADEELRSLEDYKKKVFTLERELRMKPVGPIQTKEVIVNLSRQEKESYSNKINELQDRVLTLAAENRLLNTWRDGAIRLMEGLYTFSQKGIPLNKVNKAILVNKAPSIELKPKPIDPNSRSGQTFYTPKLRESLNGPKEGKLRAGAMNILNAIASFYPDSIDKFQVAVLVGMSYKGGTFNTYLSELRRNGWIEEKSGGYIVTSEGMRAAGEVTPIPKDPESLLNMWASKFRAGAARLLREIFRVYPERITKEDLGMQTDMIHTGGTFNTYISELRRAGLIVVENNTLRISDNLFNIPRKE